jgi:anti-sigma factor RsiW
MSAARDRANDHANDHAEIREQLALFVAGALDADDESRIALHLATCADCSVELERWQVITGGLRRLPTPQAPAALFERTRAMAAAQLGAHAERRRNRVALILVIVFSWLVTLAGWPVFRFATGGFLSLLDIHFRQLWLLFVIFSALTWLAGGSAAVLLSLRRQQERRFA